MSADAPPVLAARSCSSSDDAELQTLVLSAVLGFVALAAVGLALLLARWDDWYSHSAGAGESVAGVTAEPAPHTNRSPRAPTVLFARPSAAFLLVDRDGSGAVDREELYTGVLQLYAAVPIKVFPPSRALVQALLSHLDLDRSRHLDADQFAHVMAVLSAQLLGRLIITLLFLLACPLTGGVLWTLLVDWATSEDFDAPSGAAGNLRPVLKALPHWLRCGGSILARANLGPPLLTVVLMLPLNSVVQLVEKLFTALLARGCCLGDMLTDEAGSLSPGGGGGRDARSDSVNGRQTLRRKSQIAHQVSMARRSSRKGGGSLGMWTEPLLGEPSGATS